MNLADVAAREGPVATSIDDLFRRSAERTPDALALVDPPDRAQFTDGAPRRLTYAAADAAVAAIAARLTNLGLPRGSIVATQMPNIVESALLLLGILRAGLIAAPMPLLWRKAEAGAALGRIGARALIAVGRVGEIDHGEIAAHVAAEIFAIRFVCGFGADLPDGVIPLDDVFEAPTPAALVPQSNPPGPIAAVTFDVAADGILSVAHRHSGLLAAGSAIVAEAGLAPRAGILGALATASFAGIASMLVPWLITGGKLALHQPFSPQAFADQGRERCDAAVLPGPIVPAMHDAGLLAAHALRAILAVWRSPERLATSAAWDKPIPAWIDIPVFGEAGLVPRRRGAEGAAAAVRIGPMRARDVDSWAWIEVARTARGTLAVRGAMVPQPGLLPGSGSHETLATKTPGFLDTGYPCRLDRDALVVTGPPAGLVGVGGYRFAWRELQDLVAGVEGGGSLAALPDRLAGHRLAGVAADREAVCEALAALGANPLVIGAFRDRRPPEDGRAA